MGDVINFPKSGVTATRYFCDCGNGLEYWVGDDNNAYGICPYCNLGNPCTVEMRETDEDEE